MPRRVFFSFHFQRDIFRVNQVRNCHIVQGHELAGFYDNSLWEATKLRGDAAIQNLIANGLNGSSVSVVLIGAETSNRRWVRYELEQSWQRGNGLLGVYIHNLHDQNQRTDRQGYNPLDLLGGFWDRRYYNYSNIFTTHDWVYEDGYTNFGLWVEDAYQRAQRLPHFHL